MSEASAQANLRLAASQYGARLYRNNVGAGKLEDGSFIRWGLANESTAENERIKSGDLIGIRSVLVMPRHVGTLMGQFVSREVKRPGWVFHPGSKREVAQQRWIDLINSMGGDAAFSTGEWK